MVGSARALTDEHRRCGRLETSIEAALVWVTCDGCDGAISVPLQPQPGSAHSSSTCSGTAPPACCSRTESPPTYVKEQMDHSSIQVTVDVYGHFIPGKNRGAVERLARATSLPAAPSDFDAIMTVAANVQGHTVGIREDGAPGVTRTPGTQFRKLLLYPPELRGHKDLHRTRS